jgi:hypothetical protein
MDLQGKGVTLGMNFWTTPWSFSKLLWEKMTYIKDLRESQDRENVFDKKVTEIISKRLAEFELKLKNEARPEA